MYFFPEPHGHGSLRPTFSLARVNGGGGATATSPSSAPAGQRLVVARVLVADVGHALGLLDRLHVLLASHLHRQHDLDHVLLDAVEHVGEELEGLALVFLLRILLRVAAQVDALAQVIERRQMLAPVMVEGLQHQAALELAHELGAFGHHASRSFHDCCASSTTRSRIVSSVISASSFIHSAIGAVIWYSAASTVVSPGTSHCSSIDSGGTWQLDRVLDLAADHVADRIRDVAAFQELVALLVDDAALVVGDVVVLEKLLSDVEVARLDAVLRLGDRAVDDRMLDRLALGHLELLHDDAQPLAAEDAQERVLERQVEARRARIALASRAAAQLVVDAPRLVALGARRCAGRRP